MLECPHTCQTSKRAALFAMIQIDATFKSVQECVTSFSKKENLRPSQKLWLTNSKGKDVFF